MTKQQLVVNISKKLGVEQHEVRVILEAFLKEVSSSLKSGEPLYLRGFGSFLVKKRAMKKGRDIRRNKTVEIPASSYPAFIPYPQLIKVVKENNEV